MTTKLSNAKIEAIKTARSWLELKFQALDTETTGLRGNAEIVDLALIGPDGEVLINTLVRPTSPIPAEATKIHGITNEMVIDAPAFSEIMPNLIKLTQDKLVVIYNAEFDQRMLRQSAAANNIKNPCVKSDVVCAMTLYAQFYGDWNGYRGNYKWQSQANAAKQLGIEVPDGLHRAAADAQLCRLIVEAMAATRIPGDAPVERVDSLGQRVIECRICDEETVMLGTKLCDRCYELETRIREAPELARKILDDIE